MVVPIDNLPLLALFAQKRAGYKAKVCDVQWPGSSHQVFMIPQQAILFISLDISN